MSPAPDRLVVVAGTGTEIGKTWVTERLGQLLRRDGTTFALRKPAQSFDPADTSEPTDAARLARTSGEAPTTVCPSHRWYEVAMAPPMAADHLGRRRVLLAELLGEVSASWREPVTLGLVELAGGVWSPAAHDGDGLDLTRALGPDVVVLVADAGLGTINAVRPAAAALGEVAPVVVLLNRFDPGDELHVRNRDWLAGVDGLDVVTTVEELRDRVVG